MYKWIVSSSMDTHKAGTAMSPNWNSIQKLSSQKGEHICILHVLWQRRRICITLEREVLEPLDIAYTRAFKKLYLFINTL